MYAPESIDLLQGSGLNFKQHEDHGIDIEYFGEMLVSSGLVLLPDVRWISFHSGYDFGYILKTVSLVGLPVGEDEFFDLLRIWFPCVYDIKYIMRSCKSLRGGLNDVAKDLGVRPIVIPSRPCPLTRRHRCRGTGPNTRPGPTRS